MGQKIVTGLFVAIALAQLSVAGVILYWTFFN